MTVKELKQLAKDHELKGYSRLNKEELIEFLQEADVLKIDGQTGELFDCATEEGYYTDEEASFKNLENAAIYYERESAESLALEIQKNFEEENDSWLFWTQGEAIQPEGYGAPCPPLSWNNNNNDPTIKEIRGVSVDYNNPVMIDSVVTLIEDLYKHDVYLSKQLESNLNRARKFDNPTNQEIFDGVTFRKHADEFYRMAKSKKIELSHTGELIFESILRRIKPVKYLYLPRFDDGHLMYPIVDKEKQGA